MPELPRQSDVEAQRNEDMWREFPDAPAPEPPRQSYSGTRDCAAAGCERHNRDGGDAWLERISPKGGPFVGLCQDHYGRSVVLKPEATTVLDA